MYEHTFNFNNFELYCHGLLNEFTISFDSQSRPSVTAFCKQRRASYIGSKSAVNFVSNSHYALVWRSFIYSQLWKFNLICPLCDRGLKQNINGTATGECDQVVADGVQTGFNSQYSHLVINPKRVFDESYVIKNHVYKSDRLISDKSIRSLLDRFFYRNLPPVQQDRVCVIVVVCVVRNRICNSQRWLFVS